MTGRGARGGGIGEFLTHLKTLPDAQTSMDTSGGGISISYKRAGGA